MIKIGWQSFTLKIMALLMVVLLMLGTAIIIQTRVIMNNLFTEQQAKRGISIANMLSARAANLILVHNYYDLHELVKDAQLSNDDVKYAFVVSNDGELLAHSFPEGFPGDLLAANPLAPQAKYNIAELATEEGIVREPRFVVQFASNTLALLFLGDGSLRAILSDTTRQLLFDTLVAIFIGLILTIFLTGRLTKPIRELARVTGAITGGDFTQRAYVKSNDEMGRLAGAFNSMADYLHRLMTELKQKEEARTHLLQKVIVAQEEERKRIARELHDETGQTLTSLMIGLKSLAENCPSAAQECRVEDMRAVVKTTIGEIHRLAVELRPSILDDMGLIPALEKYVADFQAAHGLDVDLHVGWGSGSRVPHAIEVTVYRIVQEALNNIAKYAQAENVSVIVTRDDNGLEAIVEDDGKGFDVEEIMSNTESNKLGLHGMRERASLVGGTFTIESSAGHGTTIYVRIPLAGGEIDGRS